ncbi:helix-turn-helix domain-containing protein [Streptodolium elevatio]|uniref:Helix-turn-helix transcriptional regulator n=1 Tax=Streptodolium elevatio TaxID=3157996 RepID=A0ABV3DJJ4_9ACTN
MANLRQTVRRLRLGMELKALRTAKAWKLEDAAPLLERSVSGLSKIETGKQRLYPRDLLIFFQVYGVTDEAKQEELKELARTSTKRNWWQPYSGVVRDPLADYLSLEEEARQIGAFGGFLVPGLLQTEAYAHAVVEASRKWEEADQVDKFVQLRMARKVVLTRSEKPAQLWTVLTEQVVRQQIGGRDVMKEQLRHLREISRDMTNVTVQLLPYSAGAHAGLDGSFTIMRFDNSGPIVCVNSLTSSTYVEDEQLERYETAWDHVKSSAMSPRETSATLKRLIEDL